MKLACQTLTLTANEYTDIEDIFQRAKEEGFKYIDVAFFEGWQNIDPSKITVNYTYWLKRLIKALEAAGLEVCAFNCNFASDLTDPDPEKYKEYKKHFKAMLRLARDKDIQCDTVVIQPGRQMPDMSFYACRNLLTERLAELGKLADHDHIKLAIEAHKDCIVEKPDDALRVIQELYPLVGCCYDPSHFTMQDIALYRTRALLDYTYHVHARDASVGNMQEVHKKGAVDFEWLYDSLKECDYKGFVSIEYFNQFDPELKETREITKIFENYGCRREAGSVAAVNR